MNKSSGDDGRWWAGWEVHALAQKKCTYKVPTQLINKSGRRGDWWCTHGYKHECEHRVPNMEVSSTRERGGTQTD